MFFLGKLRDARAVFPQQAAIRIKEEILSVSAAAGARIIELDVQGLRRFLDALIGIILGVIDDLFLEIAHHFDERIIFSGADPCRRQGHGLSFLILIHGDDEPVTLGICRDKLLDQAEARGLNG